MAADFYSKIETQGRGDLVAFRDAALTFSRAFSLGETLYLDADPEATELAAWLGIAFETGTAGAASCIDESRRQSFPDRELTVLCDAGSLPTVSVAEYRKRGLLGETVFAALVRSSYGPDTPDYFPTRSELKVTFDEHPLREGAALWDEDYLQQCQEFFMEELTPTQLLSRVLQVFDSEKRAQLEQALEPWESVLRSAIFLVGETSTSLAPLALFLERLLKGEPIPGVSLQDPLPPDQRGLLEQYLFVGFEELSEELIYALGPEFLGWRCGLVKA